MMVIISESPDQIVLPFQIAGSVILGVKLGSMPYCVPAMCSLLTMGGTQVRSSMYIPFNLNC